MTTGIQDGESINAEESLWIPLVNGPPPEGAIVMTKVHDLDGCRNVERLKWKDRLWWTMDGRWLPYSPTHWKQI